MACGTKMIPTISPDITSPQIYSWILYFGNQPSTGKNPVTVVRALGTEQVALFFNLDFRTETLDCCWRTRRSSRGCGAVDVSATLVTFSMVLGRTRRFHGQRRREGGSAVLLEKHRQEGLQLAEKMSLLSLFSVLFILCLFPLPLLFFRPRTERTSGTNRTKTFDQRCMNIALPTTLPVQVV